MKTTCHWVVLGLLAFAGAVLAAPQLDAPRNETDPELTAGYFQGDIIPDDGVRNGKSDESYRWPNKKVFYRFGDHFDEEHTNYILRAMGIIQKVSCIRFIKANNWQEYYINITNNPAHGCSAYIGFLPKVRNVNLAISPLDRGCFRIGSILHELLHTLGFVHMQTASNRDEYVRIANENIKEKWRMNFEKSTDTHGFDQAYDYASVMHYPPYAYSVNGKRTIIALKDREGAGMMGQRVGMSKSDIAKLNAMYRCRLRPKTSRQRFSSKE